MSDELWFLPARKSWRFLLCWKYASLGKKYIKFEKKGNCEHVTLLIVAFRVWKFSLKKLDVNVRAFHFDLMKNIFVHFTKFFFQSKLIIICSHNLSRFVCLLILFRHNFYRHLNEKYQTNGNFPSAFSTAAERDKKTEERFSVYANFLRVFFHFREYNTIYSLTGVPRVSGRRNE